jgi:hypothetical protein
MCGREARRLGPHRRQGPRTGRPTAWVDAAGHRSGRLAVGGTDVHYIDYGGAGQPLVFLADLDNSAHVFDEFARRLTDRFRVVAITRRGTASPVGPRAANLLRGPHPTKIADATGTASTASAGLLNPCSWCALNAPGV